MLFQHGLAYLLGLEGYALLRAFAGENDQAFIERRFAKIEELLANSARFGDGVTLPAITTIEGYERWAESYDEPGNGLIEIEEPVVRSILDPLPIGVALDAACGTGRHAEYLESLGHRVIGVDASPHMLERARQRVPEAEFHEGDLLTLPVADESVDIVVCALALTHVADLDAAMRELTRVLRPGGHLVISDAHGLAGGLRPPILMRLSEPDPGYLPHTNRLVGDYVRAALSVGLVIRRCEEPRSNDERGGGPLADPWPLDAVLPDGPPNIWLLHLWDPEATRAAFHNQPGALVLHLQRPE